MNQRTILVVALVLAGAALAGGRDAQAASYDELRDQSEETGDLAFFLEPLYAKCAVGGDVAARQCDLIRSWYLERLHAGKFRLKADAAALQAQPYDATQKSITLAVGGCLACKSPPEVAGGKRLLVTAVPTGIAGGVPVGVELGYHDVPLADAKEARRWVARVLPHLGVEYLFTVGAPFTVPNRGDGVKVTVQGHRVYNRCTGEILASQPPSTVTRVAPDEKCAEDKPTEEELAESRALAALPQTLTYRDIDKVMSKVADRIAECATEFELKGVAQLKLLLRGDGQGSVIKVMPPFDKGDAGLCLRVVLRTVVFPKFRDLAINLDYAFVLGGGATQ